MKFDAIDIRILRELQQDGSLSNVELARRVHLSPSPCLARVKALEAAGVIGRYVALANASALGLGLNVFINISLRTQSKEALAVFDELYEAMSTVRRITEAMVGGDPRYTDDPVRTQGVQLDVRPEYQNGPTAASFA